MKQAEWRTLRGQLLLTAGLFLCCVAIAVGMVSQRWLYESYMAEKYLGQRSQLSSGAKELADLVNRGKTDEKAYARLSPSERIILYEIWMQAGEEASKMAPRALAQMDPEFYLHRAEQTVVCGNVVQRGLALEFLRLSEADCSERLDRLAAWAERRRREDWLLEIEEARQRK
jgi:hypothetical protein